MTTQNDVLPGEGPNPTGTSSPPANKRLAPRSSNQFRIGPPFCATINKIPIYNSKNAVVTPKICARLDRGFNLIEGEWIGYKRNYFTLVASFFFVDCPLNIAATDNFFYYDSQNCKHHLTAFKIMLTSICPEDNASAVTLVQHTAKRDRGPQNAPPVYYAVPGQLPPHLTMKLVANIRNGEKIDRCNRLFYLLQEEVLHIVLAHPTAILAKYPRDRSISLVSRYERIQFSSAGCGNRKSASTNNKHYILVIQLLGEDTTGHDVVLAYSESPPLVVRGRSPSNYPPQAGNGVAEGTGEKGSPSTQFDAPTALANNPSELPGCNENYKDFRTCDENFIPVKKAKMKQEPEIKRPHFSLNRAPTALGYWDSLDPQFLPPSALLKKRDLPIWETTPEDQAPLFLLGRDDVFHADLPFMDPDTLVQDLDSPAFPGDMPDLWNNLHPDDDYPQELPAPLKGTYTREFPDFPMANCSPDSQNIFGQFPPGLIQQNFYESPQASGDFFEPLCLQDTPNSGGVGQEGILNERMQSQHSSENPELVDLENYPFMNTYSTYQALTAPVVISNPLYTSTPLQLKIESRVREEVNRFHCDQVAALNPNVKRCKHGFKARTRERAARLYSMEDLQWPEALDAGYVRFKHKLDSFKKGLESPERENLGSLMILSLTTISSNE